MVVTIPTAAKADGFDIYIDTCNGEGCGNITCTGGHCKYIVRAGGHDLAINIHEQPQHYVTALQSQRITFDFETSIVIDLERRVNGDCRPREVGKPTIQKSILDRRDRRISEQVKERNVLGSADFEILVLAHRNNLTGVITSFENNKRLSLADNVLHNSPFLREIRLVRARARAAAAAEAEAEASQRRQRSNSLPDRRSCWGQSPFFY
ncbi:hypothetical protein MMC15_000981 [Xylographa vitiligo]|nr:hypothetical protein [Xylographa vitiligo]